MESSTPPAGTAAVTVTTVQDGRISRAADLLATEVPVALHCNGSPFVVMMATPHQLDDFAHGFSVSEGLVDSIDEITACAVRPIEPGRPLAGFEIALQIPPARHAALLKRQRNLLGR
ncbi:MAG TPA: formate dehydrogenase accessory sulfurtransferase FdhD, partial [Pseudomonadales bacterium]|nr:formate dehydrogenase accessory sulfurtransferase FdhD [Pseudomonadales bacterium]